MTDATTQALDLIKDETFKPLFQLMHNQPAEVTIQDGQPLRVSGIANTGGVMHHWHWGNFALNLSGGQAADRIYLMTEHDKLAGIIDETTFQDAIRVSGFVDEDEPEGAVLARRLRKGYPLQMSVYFDPLPEPGAVEKLEPGQGGEVNGHRIMGPGHIIHKYRIYEASAVLFGVDNATSITALKKHLSRRGIITPEEITQLQQEKQRLENELKTQKLAALKDVFEDDAKTVLNKLGLTDLDTLAANLKPLPGHLFRDDADRTDGVGNEGQQSDHVNQLHAALDRFGGA